jgi:AcrR family transcriptional regulator
MTLTTQKTAGRPRSTEADAAILQTTLRLLVEQGYDAMSMEGVAAAAGVGKTTIYRRYPTKRELVVAAVSSLASSVELPPYSGDTRADLYNFVHAMASVLTGGRLFAMLGTLLVKEREEPAMLDLFRQQVILPRMEIVAQLLDRGIEHGQVRPDVQVEITAQMLAGSIFARHVTGFPEDDKWLEDVIDNIWRGIAR